MPSRTLREAIGGTGGESVIIRRRLEAVFQETTTVLDEVDKNANARIDLDHNRHVTHAWLNRTGWARYLGSLDRE